MKAAIGWFIPRPFQSHCTLAKSSSHILCGYAFFFKHKSTILDREIISLPVREITPIKRHVIIIISLKPSWISKNTVAEWKEFFHVVSADGGNIEESKLEVVVINGNATAAKKNVYARAKTIIALDIVRMVKNIQSSQEIWIYLKNTYDRKSTKKAKLFRKLLNF
ncbi:hypothetical protein FF38_07393 [Lucilia cuprina]|uniref:Uncharacterized protein n=1 Tax=Lucilia cuprina TaxID=7375 RepID=A0A0L0CJ32_LUCCU|nr:hypothetical protein FF38_07393 [Lucilia cuprina]